MPLLRPLTSRKPVKTAQPSVTSVHIRSSFRGIALFGGALGLIIASSLTDVAALATVGIGLVIAAAMSLLELRWSAQQLRWQSGNFDHILSSVRPTSGDSVVLTTVMPPGLWLASARSLRWQHEVPTQCGHATLSTPTSGDDGDFQVSTVIVQLRRGHWPLGELVGFRDDILGLAKLTVRLGIAESITVWPATHPADPPGEGLDSAETANAGSPLLHAQDDTTLREYTVGDDLRRVHWPSSARHGDLLVKNSDSSEQGQLSVILLISTRNGEISSVATEAAITLAASVLRSAHEDAMPARLAIPGTTPHTHMVGEFSLSAQLDQLSATRPISHSQDLLVALARDLAAVGHQDHCILILAGDLPDGASQTLRSFAANAQSSAALVVAENGESPGDIIHGLSAASWRIIPVDAHRPRLELQRLGAAWRK